MTMSKFTRTQFTRMTLPPYSLIYSISRTGIFGIEGTCDSRPGLPWYAKEDQKFFYQTTTATNGQHGQNILIMGRKTFENIGHPLKNRISIVVTDKFKNKHTFAAYVKHRYGLRNWAVDDSLILAESFPDALTKSGELIEKKLAYRIFVIGGVELLAGALENAEFIYETKICLTDKTKTFTSLHADKTLVYGTSIMSKLLDAMHAGDIKEFSRNEYISEDGLYYLSFRTYENLQRMHPEHAYLALLRRIITNGVKRPNRTGIDTLSLWGEMLAFDIEKNFPLFTTKQVPFKSMVKELLFFISGKTDTTILETQGVKIWMGNTRREFLDKRGLHDLKEGEMGEGYPIGWRHFGVVREANRQLEIGQGGVDQLANVIENIKLVKEDPTREEARRLLVSAWNPATVDKACLPPCHFSYIFNVENDRLNCLVNLRSNDVFLGLPWNVASYALLTYMIAHIVGLKPGKLVISIADAHLYINHVHQATTQLYRKPVMWPCVKIVKTHTSIDEFTVDSFELQGYFPHSKLEGAMAV